MTQPPEKGVESTTATEEKKERGRPTIYSEEIAKQVCTETAQGKSLRSICKNNDLPHRHTIMYWLQDEDKVDFFDRYTRAKLIRAECMADDLLDIADDAANDYMEREEEEDNKSVSYSFNGEHFARSRLRVDTRKWYLGKVLPKVYGDALKIKGDPDEPLQHNHTHEFKPWDDILEKLKASKKQ
jgi:hypothetical protein